MKFYKFLLFLSLLATINARPYFQQKVSYSIQVKLNVSNQTYLGKERVTYINNSPDTLHKILFHLYPNAYSDDHTPFAMQQKRFANSRFHFSTEKERGYLHINKILCGNSKLKTEVNKNAVDECTVFLNNALAPGDSVTLKMEFKGKFPHVFSRMGHTRGKYYAATQWYPKVVVYDVNGWHPDSYLDMGEFYGEFADFDVRITLPENYIIDATGLLQNNPKEQAFIDSIAAETARLLLIKDEDERENYVEKWLNAHKAKTDTTELKTVRFIAHNVHDFAWFAGENYMIHKRIQPDGVLTHVLVLPKNAYNWKDVPLYVERTLKFYGMRVGPYQYPKASVVDGSLAAGGGMEYPMITIISTPYTSWTRFLEMVVMHEVGHNWFYGMLGSDERASTFMDEGNNAFTEWKYMEHYYGERNLTLFDSLLGKWNTLSDVGEFDINYLTYGNLVSQQHDLPLNLRAEKYTRSAYGGINYAKSAFMLRALEWLIGEPVYIKAMHTYFNTWKGRHPTVEDFWDIMSGVSGMDLNSFRYEWMETTHYNDFTVENIQTVKENGQYKTTVFLKNLGTMAPLPAPVYLITKKDTSEQRWDGIADHPVIFEHDAPLINVAVNLKHIIYETNYLNNGLQLPVEVHFMDPIPSFTTYRGTYYPYLYYEPAKDKTRFGVGGWIGNPITLQHFITAKIYYGTASGQTGFGLAYNNRLPGFIGNYSDFKTAIQNTDGMRSLSGELKMVFSDRMDDNVANTFTVKGHYVDLYDADYNEPGIYEKYRYASLGLSGRIYRRRMLYQWFGAFKFEKGFPAGKEAAEYNKWELAARLNFKLARWLSISPDLFAGGITGDHIPQQEYIFAGGFVDPKHERFTPAYRGRYAPLRGYTYLEGMNLWGHAGTTGGYLKNKAGYALGLKLNLPFGFALYGRGGAIAADWTEIKRSALMREYGLQLKFQQLNFVFPLYVENPSDGSAPFAFRMFMHIDFNIRFGR